MKALIQIKGLHVIFCHLCMSMLLVAGCITSISEKPKGEYVWPPPPHEPKIKWLAQWSNQYDFGRPKGIEALIAGDAEARLSRPGGIVADSAGNIYVADADLKIIFVFDLEQRQLRFIGGGTLSSPTGLAIDNSKGVLYVADSGFDRVFGFNKKDGRPVLVIGRDGEYRNPSGIVIDEERDRLYLSDTQNHIVRVLTREGRPLFTIGGRGNDNGKFNFPSFLALDKEGRLYVSDSFNFRVQIFDADGKFIRAFGRLGDVSGTFTRPKGIGVDSDGNIYVVDAAFGNFQIFDNNGALLLWVGEIGSSPGQFYLPSGMYIDRNDRIYVSDTFNRRVQVFQYLKQKQF